MTEETIRLIDHYYTESEIDSKISILDHLQTVQWTINYADNTTEVINIVKYV